MAHWSLSDIAWHEFDPTQVTPELLSLIKAASVVEHNGRDYARYLCEVFSDDETMQQAAKEWAEEEVQHGKALRKWAELADPTFNFNQSFKNFSTGYCLPVNVQASVRGSRSGELIARCVVEIGTSSYYTAIKEYTTEPVLAALCAKIAADEFRHYKLFYTHLQRYLEIENLGLLQRIKTVLSRIAESEDDELAYAFYAVHSRDYHNHYNRKACTRRYMACVGPLSRRGHLDRMIAMAFKTVGIKPYSLVHKCVGCLAWNIMKLRVNMDVIRSNHLVLSQ